MDIHPQAQRLLAAMAAEGAPPLYELSPEEARGVPAAIAELIGPSHQLAFFGADNSRPTSARSVWHERDGTSAKTGFVQAKKWVDTVQRPTVGKGS